MFTGLELVDVCFDSAEGAFEDMTRMSGRCRLKEV